MSLIEVHKIDDRLYILNENLKPGVYFTMALVIGGEKAAIIDTGYGASGDLDRVIRGITDKPVVCLLTHCDPDHAGGAALFDDIHMSSLDEELMRSGSLSPLIRRMIIRKTCADRTVAAYTRKHMVKASRFSYRNIADGETFDLGDCVLEAVSLGGHSKGSMCFWNREEHYVIAGDSVANVNSAVLFFGKCLPLSAYRRNLQRFAEKVGGDVDIYTGHDILPLKKQVVPELLVLCAEIIAGNAAHDAPYIAPFLRASERANPLARAAENVMLKAAAKKQLGGSLPREHKKAGFIASVKYNAHKI